MMPKRSKSIQKVQDALKELGLACQVQELPSSTRTAEEAAQSIGCQVEQIVKSLVFEGKESQSPILVLASGRNRVNEKKIGKIASEKIGKADADFVKEHTGFVIGGVPPLGHLKPLQTFIDEDLLNYETLWAAAGTPQAVFELTPQDLKNITQGQVICCV